MREDLAKADGLACFPGVGREFPSVVCGGCIFCHSWEHRCVAMAREVITPSRHGLGPPTLICNRICFFAKHPFTDWLDSSDAKTYFDNLIKFLFLKINHRKSYDSQGPHRAIRASILELLFFKTFFRFLFNFFWQLTLQLFSF